MIPGFSPEFLIPEISILEKIVRPLLVYLFLLLAFRIFGKRELGQLTPSDLIILLIISNVVQNAMIGHDDSLTGGLIGASTVLVANFAVAYLTYHIPWFYRLVEGDSTKLVENGNILYANLRKELITVQDLRQALRRNGIDPDEDMESLKRVELDSDGQITILRRSNLDLPHREQNQHKGAKP